MSEALKLREALPELLRFSLTKTTRRLTFDILEQAECVTHRGSDEGPYHKFVASNGYEVISRSRMDIQTERLWLLGAKRDEEARSGTMVFSSDEKRDTAYNGFMLAISEWATANGGVAMRVGNSGAALTAQPIQAGEPVYWEWRHMSSHPDTVDFGKWSEWQRVEPRNALCTVDDALDEFRSYIAGGYKYELRALYTRPALVPMTPEDVESIAYKFANREFSDQYLSDITDIVRAAEAHHAKQGGV